MDRFQPLFIDMRIYLRRRYIGVAKQLLHHAKVRSALQQMRREAVPERVRRYLFLDARQLRILLYHLPERYARNLLAEP